MEVDIDNKNENTKNTDCWIRRRRFMMFTVIFCMLVITYILTKPLETGPSETAMSMAFLIIGTTITSYVFGAAWEHIRLGRP